MALITCNDGTTGANFNKIQFSADFQIGTHQTSLIVVVVIDVVVVDGVVVGISVVVVAIGAVVAVWGRYRTVIRMT